MEDADTCTQDTSEMSTPEGLPLDISDNNQRQDAEKIGEKHEGEGEAEMSNDTAEFGEKESRDMDSSESTGVEIMKDNAEDIGRKTGAELREVLSEGTNLDENLEVQSNGRGGLDDVTQNRPCEDLVGDEQFGKGTKTSSNYLTKDDREYGGSNCKDQEVEQKHFGKQEVEEKMEVNLEGDKEGKTGDDKLTSGSRKLSGGKLNKTKDDQDEHGDSDKLYGGPEQQSEEMKGVKEEQKRVDNEHAHRGGASMRKHGSDKEVKGQDKERPYHVIQDGQERKLDKIGQRHGLECVSVDKQGDEEIIKLKPKKDKGNQEMSNTKPAYSRHFVDKQGEKGDDGCAQRREISVSYNGDHVEDQNNRRYDEAGQNRWKTNNDTQPDVRSGSHSVKRRMMDGSDHTKEEKVKRRDSNDQSISKTGDEEVKTEMIKKGSKKSCTDKVNPETKKLTTDSLAKSVHDLKLSHTKSPKPEPQEHEIVQYSNSAGLSNAEEMQNEPMTGLLLGKKKSKEKGRRRWWHLKHPLKSDKKGKKKHRTTPGCFCIWKSRKNQKDQKDQMSD